MFSMLRSSEWGEDHMVLLQVRLVIDFLWRPNKSLACERFEIKIPGWKIFRLYQELVPVQSFGKQTALIKQRHNDVVDVLLLHLEVQLAKYSSLRTGCANTLQSQLLHRMWRYYVLL